MKNPVPSDRSIAAFIANTKPGTVRKWVALGNGLALVIEPSGMKTFQARFRLRDSNQAKRLVIGHYPTMTLAEARVELNRIKSEARSGSDPSLAKARSAAGTGALSTIDELAEIFLSRREGHVAKSTLATEREQLQILRKALGKRRVKDVEPRDIAKVIDDYLSVLRKKGRPGTRANRVLEVTRRMFNTAKGWGLIENGNPAAELKRRVKEKPRDRILWDGQLLCDPARPTLNELGQLMAALLDDNSPILAEKPTRIAIALSMLLGLRVMEVASLEWSNIDLKSKDPTLTIPKSKTAAGTRTLPLPPCGKKLILSLGSADEGTFLFPASNTRPDIKVARLPHLHPQSISRAVARAAMKLNIPELTHHDLRRTVASGLGELGFESITPRILGHAPSGVTNRHYDHSKRQPAMRAALEAWEKVVLAAAERHGVSSPLVMDQ